MDIPNVEAEIKKAIALYKYEYAAELKALDDMIESVLTSSEDFRKFWLVELLRARMAILADHLISLRGIYESRN